MTEHVDVVVIGAGAMGSSTAWHLARAGKSVVVLEQFERGHVVGASHGSTRNISAAYPDDDYQVLLTETRALWRELDQESGETLIDWVGLVQHGQQDPLRVLHETHARHGIHSEFVGAEEAARRWSGFRFSGDVLHTVEAGRIRAADGLRVIQQLAAAAGADFRYSTPVREVEVGADSATVHHDGGSIHAGRVVVTAGAWTSKLVPGSVPLPTLRVTQEQPAHFAELGDHTWPGFMHTPEPGERDAYWPGTIYGMRTAAEGVKVGWHGTGPVTDPDERTFEYVPEQMDALRRYVRDWIPGADPDRFAAISCTYTTTPTEDFVLDRVGPLVIGAGFSGHGFKFTPVIGRVLADLLEDRRPAERFRLPVA